MARLRLAPTRGVCPHGVTPALSVHARRCKTLHGGVPLVGATVGEFEKKSDKHRVASWAVVSCPQIAKQNRPPIFLLYSRKSKWGEKIAVPSFLRRNRRLFPGAKMPKSGRFYGVSREKNLRNGLYFALFLTWRLNAQPTLRKSDKQTGCRAALIRTAKRGHRCRMPLVTLGF